MTKNTRNWRWSTWVRLFLAGWRPNRDVWDELTLPNSFVVFPAARLTLSRYGNLTFRHPSETVTLDPSAGEEAAEEIAAFEKELGFSLYPIGLLDGGDTIYLLIDERGVVYSMSDELQAFALTADRAVEYLVRHDGGFDDELDSIGMLGKTWRLD